MTTGKTWQAFAPASTANLASGFDVLGVSLAPVDGAYWGDIVTVKCPSRPRRSDLFSVVGPHADSVPKCTTDNLVMISRKLFNNLLRSLRVEPVFLEIELSKNLPVCSGLGSSASSVVAALVALNAAHGDPISSDRLLTLAGQAEGKVSGSIHLDNVAPSLLGGVQLIVPGTNGSRLPVSLPWFSSWHLVVVHPAIQVPTSEARAVLPETFERDSAVDYWSTLAGLVHAFHTGNEELARRCVKDNLVEPHRRSLVKAFNSVKSAAFNAGAFACSLSGSGPSMFALTGNRAQADDILDAMIQAFSRSRVKSSGFVCRPDTQGARILNTEECP